jgi:hypothetical protein
VPRVFGVDVSLGRGLDVVLLEDATVKETWTRMGPRALTELLWAHRPDAIAIDSPPRAGLGLLREDAERSRLPVPPPAGKHVARRVAEYELSRRGIGSHQTHYEEARLFSWMTAGFEAFSAAREGGYGAYLGQGRVRRTALEVFPYASYVALSGCLSPGRRLRLAWRRAVLAEAGVAGLPEIAAIDLLDAACAAFTGARFLEGDGSFVGDPREGVIVLPVRSLNDHYRRCAPPDAPIHPAGRVDRPRLCECGCGVSVRRRFLPGHDARLRSRLVKEARAGLAARRQLARLGWSRALEDLDAEEE